MKSGAAAHYDVTSTSDLMRLDVKSIAADDCVLIMWWVGSMPQDAMALVEAWGFEIKTMTGFVWNKITVREKPFFGMGHWTRAGAECAIIATRGKPKRVSGSVRSVGTYRVSEHSKKPDEFRERCIELVGDVPRIELFARQAHAGWDVFGNEAPGSINIPVPNLDSSETDCLVNRPVRRSGWGVWN